MSPKYRPIEEMTKEEMRQETRENIAAAEEILFGKTSPLTTAEDDSHHSSTDAPPPQVSRPDE